MRIFADNKRARIGAVVGVLALLITMCTGAAAATPTSPEPVRPVVSASAAFPMTVRMTEFRLELPTHLAPGPYAFNAVNAGRIVHALAIDGPGVANQSTAVVQSGQSAVLNVTLVPGSYRFYCPVGRHAEEGMEVAVFVG
ncbi:hypothetical protein MOQ72_03160 [Saccharopolyspora sp. K220]|uniref:hypothetical protein n=1 Tax=Saccharopolyspora soli TaxID=2926618 RepID=UPI001F5AC0AF|nr:hypothetical protein [Saccharopolyspora soli]MCI2416411.1 hypothetical protein [Saccharopolyspora soli]